MFTPFTKDERPTMEAFNQKFQEAIVQSVEEALEKGAKVEIGSYTGAGKSGVDNPNIVYFSFPPKFFKVFGTRQTSDKRWTTGVIPTYNLTFVVDELSTSYKNWTPPISGNTSYSKKSDDGKTLYWYGKDVDVQLNNSAYEYFWVAIG